MIKRWEYECVDFENNGASRYTDDDNWTDYSAAEKEFNSMGDLGWELVSVTNNGKAFFKRALP